MKKYALASTVKDGFLCKQDHSYEVSTGDNYEAEYENSLVLFDTEAEAMQFIEEHEYWALEPVEYTNESV